MHFAVDDIMQTTNSDSKTEMLKKMLHKQHFHSKMQLYGWFKHEIPSVGSCTPGTSVKL